MRLGTLARLVFGAVVVAVIYDTGYRHGITAGRDAWTRAVRRDADEAMERR